MNQNRDLRIVIAYDDLPAGLRARELVANLTAQLPPEMDIHTGVWKFDCLKHPSLWQAAATETSEADMIIIASDAAGLPARVAGWVESCLRESGGRRTALVALPPLDGEPPGKSPSFCDTLRQVAERRQASFFCPKTGRQRLDGLGDFEIFNRRVATIPVEWEDVPDLEPAGREGGIND